LLPDVKTRYQDLPVYITKDGSLIRELMHPARHGKAHQSLAEATISPGFETALHKHLRTEELYHIVAGRGVMTCGQECFEVGPGDTVHIPPGTLHCIRNNGPEPLRILCCCAPAYAHEDTVLWEA
jgi:mannose-6-phosphate isomerase-like protein (cupin superfamily)